MSRVQGGLFIDERGCRVRVERVWRGHQPAAWEHLPHDLYGRTVLWPRRLVKVRTEVVPPGRDGRVGAVLVRPFNGLQRVPGMRLTGAVCADPLALPAPGRWYPALVRPCELRRSDQIDLGQGVTMVVGATRPPSVPVVGPMVVLGGPDDRGAASLMGDGLIPVYRRSES